MESRRQLQVAEVIKRNFSMVLFQEGRYIYGDDILVSVTNVKMSPDLSLAKIYLSIYNTDNKQATLIQLEEQTHRLKSLLAQKIRKQVRRIPDVHLYIDETLDEMYKIERLFEDINKNKPSE
jgi:ribosome-binding factor A